MNRKFDENNRSAKTTYKSKKWRWITYVAIPAATLLFFLLFLASIEHAKYEVNANVAQAPKSLILSHSNPLLIPSAIGMKATENSLKCHINSNNNCELHCTGEMNATLINELTKQQTACSQDLQLYLTNCFFPDDTLTPELFAGAYNLATLTINCNLKHIMPKTFEQAALANLTQLEFENTTLENLNEETFKGLTALSVLHLSNNDNSSFSTFKNFLKPLATKLTQLKLTQRTLSKEHDPKSWFGGEKYEKLISLDLSHNRFPHCLNEETFENLKAVQILSLNDCEIEEIGFNTFSPMAATLKYLYLKNNHLKELNVDFLAQMSVQSLTLELAFNDWNCSCNIDGLINAIQQQTIGFIESPKCKSPNVWQNWSLADVTIICDFINGSEETTNTEVESTTATDYESAENTNLENSTPIESSSTISIPTAPHKPSTPSTTPTTIEYYDTTDAPHACAKPILATPFPMLFLSCTRKDGSTYQPNVYDTDAVFSIHTLSETSVEIIIEHSYFITYVNLFYFDEHKNSYITSKILDSANITQLIPSTAYTFCLAPLICVSPFNCRSHYLKIFVAESPKAWLTSEDKVLFISLTLLIAVLFMIFAGIAMYFTLRWRPIWLKGNRRIMRLNSQSPKVILHPKPEKVQSFTSFLADQQHRTVQRESTSTFSEFSANFDRSPNLRPRARSSPNSVSNNNYIEFEEMYEKIY